jgi:hypothetical protein
MPIPAVEPIAPAPAQSFGEYALGDSPKISPTTFHARASDRDGERAHDERRRSAKKRTVKRSTTRQRGRESAENAVSLPVLLVGLAAIAVVLALLGYFVPGVRKPAGVALALPGVLLCVYGYASGAYIAFTEDDFHGWLYLLFPFYAAYYVVSRWDEMRSRLIMVGIGLTLAAIGGRLLEVDRAHAESVAEAEAEAKA